VQFHPASTNEQLLSGFQKKKTPRFFIPAVPLMAIAIPLSSILLEGDMTKHILDERSQKAPLNPETWAIKNKLNHLLL